ncbi:hypothetical protein BAE51_08305 [Moraxella catarrhalis]|nr:hypothetical protein BAE51_08305 [Moraxella catarrhalis]
MAKLSLIKYSVNVLFSKLLAFGKLAILLKISRIYINFLYGSLGQYFQDLKSMTYDIITHDMIKNQHMNKINQRR